MNKLKLALISVIPVFTVSQHLLTSCNLIREKRPNIIVIMTDDQGWGDLSIHGNTNLNTPNLDRLAKEGAQFKNFYVSPVSSPTRAEFLTGRYHPRCGVSSTSEGGERINLDETTVAEIFRAAGYATGAFGKWHSGMQYPYHPNGRGFDEFYGFCSGHLGDYFDPLIEHNGKIVRGNGYLPDDLTDRAIDFIEENRDNPFFLFIPQITPHSPMQVPDRWWNEVEGRTIDMRADDRYDEDLEFTKAALAMCENIDWNVGRILEKLKELRLEKNTVVVFLSDNGPNSYRWNGGLRGRKGSVDEGGVKSPLFIRWPGKIKPGLEIEEIAGAIDLFPTLTALANIEYRIPLPQDGLNLRPLLFRESSSWDDRVILSFWNGRLSARNQQYRLDNEGRLYDMTRDPGQTTNIVGQNQDVYNKLLSEKIRFSNEVLSELDRAPRPFTVGHPDARYTQLPARDATAGGNITRSNRFPNSSFYTNWVSSDDYISWDVAVLKSGNFDVTIYYTCPPEDTGSALELSLRGEALHARIIEGHDPPLRGMEHDRVKRIESYVKDFKPLNMGTIYLNQGRGELLLKATDIPGSQVMDFRTMILERVD